MSAADARNQPAPTRQRILDAALLKTLTLVAALLVALTTHAQRTDDNLFLGRAFEAGWPPASLASQLRSGHLTGAIKC